MEEWLKAQIESGFSAFAGARLSGSIPLTEQLLNELLQEWLKNPAGFGASSAGGSASPGAQFSRWVTLVSEARVEVTAGMVTVKFELKV